MTNPENSYQPSPKEIRDAESSMTEKQRELTADREDDRYVAEQSIKENLSDLRRSYLKRDFEKLENEYLSGQGPDLARVRLIAANMRQGVNELTKVLDEIETNLNTLQG